MAVGSINDLVSTITTDPEGAGETIATAAGDVATLAEEQADADVPPGFEELNDAAVKMFESFASALDNLATGIASFDMVAIQGVTAEIEAAGAQNEEVVGVVNAIAEGCGLEVPPEQRRALPLNGERRVRIGGRPGRRGDGHGFVPVAGHPSFVRVTRGVLVGWSGSLIADVVRVSRPRVQYRRAGRDGRRAVRPAGHYAARTRRASWSFGRHRTRPLRKTK